MSDAIEGHAVESPLNLNTEVAETAPVETVATESAPVIAPVETKPETVETKPEIKADAPDDDRLRRGYAALARKEKSLRERETQLKRLEGLEKKAKESPLEFLKEFGLSYDQLTDLILGADEKPEPTADDRVAALEARLENERVAREAADAAAKEANIERQINTFKTGVLAHGIKSNPDKYELINARGDDGVELVFEVIQSHFEKTQEVLSWDKAADYTEEHLETEARKLLSLKKFKPAATPTSQEPRSQESNTLSRSNAGEMPVVNDDELPMDPEERTRAILSRNRLWA